jgi:hypothetical protein
MNDYLKNLQRRKSERSWLAEIRYVLLDGDIGMLLLLGGLGLILWAIMGTMKSGSELIAYARMFPFGDASFWFLNYIACGVSMWVLVARQMPPVLSLLVGGWVTMIWSWSLLARVGNVATMQTGNATSVMYIIIGLLIIQRSSRR